MKEQREQAAKDARRTTEILWCVDQDEPKLKDEGLFLISSLRDLRDDESLAFAEERLARLGFNLSIEGNARSYTQETGDYVVYADPRERGRIEFRAFSKKKLTRRFGSAGSGFNLQESWQNDLPRKSKAKLDEAVSRL
jgi:hypothetical protein